MAGLGGDFSTNDDRTVRVDVPDEQAFEAMRHVLGDPVWLLGATWQILTTNEFKRGRFEDAFGAWTARQGASSIESLLTPAGVRVAST